MASGSQVSEKYAMQDAGNLVSTGELERLRNRLKEAMKKNQDLEEMLLYTAQELEKEKEISRKIVQTLTGRLMESRETINKLEVENMRYKKDCMLAVELLQCNRKVDHSEVSKTVRRLSDYDQPEPHTRGTGINPFAIQDNKPDSILNPKITKDETKNLQPNRQELSSNKKKGNEAGINGNAEDTAALLEAHDHVSMHGKRLPYNTRAKLANGDEMLDMAGVPLMNGTNNKERLSNDQLNYAAGTSLENKDKGECFTNTNSLNGSVKLESTTRQDELKGVDMDRPEKIGSCLRNETEFLNDEEDRPLIVDEATSSTQPSFIATKNNENTELRREYAKAKVCDGRDKVDKEINKVKEDTSLILSTKTNAEDDVFHVNAVRGEPEGDNENDSLLDERKNEDIPQQTSDIPQQTSEISQQTSKIPQQTSSEDNETVHTFVKLKEYDTTETEDDEKVSMDHDSSLKEGETEPNGKEIATRFEEGEDETLTGEENTPLV